MPIYEYQCEKCGHHLEALQKLSDKPLRECPECGRHRLKRLMSAPLFRLAGSGWYETDFKSDKEQKRNLVEKGGSEPAAPAAAESKADGKSASVPVAKAESTPAAKPEARPAADAGASSRRGRTAKPAAKAPPKAPSRKKAPARARKR
jgi:putative FmdB family regulatory protein